MQETLPSQKDFIIPTFKAFHNLNGSGANREVYDEVARIMNLSDKQLEIPHKRAVSMATNRIQWAMDRLKRHQLATNPKHGFWILTPKGRITKSVDADQVSKIRAHVGQKQARKEKQRESSSVTDVQYATLSHTIATPGQKRLSTKNPAPEQILDQADTSPISMEDPIDSLTQWRDSLPSNTDDSGETLPFVVEGDEDEKWKDELYVLLLQMCPSAFERLFQRILRESGFTKVDVTGRSGDGGIDGVGVLRLGGFLSIRVLFQCKRYKGSIGTGVVRDFRGAMVGRTDKGLIVTTGNFTPAAKREATRDGAPEIDLVDGEQLIDKLKELDLGVSTELVPKVTVDPDFFDNI